MFKKVKCMFSRQKSRHIPILSAKKRLVKLDATSFVMLPLSQGRW